MYTKEKKNLDFIEQHSRNNVLEAKKTKKTIVNSQRIKNDLEQAI